MKLLKDVSFFTLLLLIKLSRVFVEIVAGHLPDARFAHPFFHSKSALCSSALAF